MRLFSTVLPYILLVTFYTGTINNFGMNKINAINDSPYNGVAVPLFGAYNSEAYPDIGGDKDFEKAIKLIKKESKKHIWPWVFFNRFVGYKEGKRFHSQLAKKEYFREIKGLDIYNESGALGDFKHIWRLALKMAKRLGSPGIVVDPETYNNYTSYNLTYISDELGRSKNDVKTRLKELGGELVGIAEKEYPDATIWFLFTGLERPVKNLNPFTKREYRTVTYIIQGMLERAKKKRVQLKFISGGEVSLGYCYESLGNLKRSIVERKDIFASTLDLYPNLLLSGTIALWEKSTSKKGWMLKGQCGMSKIEKLAEFKPLLNHLSTAYKYVWIYAATAAGYDPYNYKISKPYNKLIFESINEPHE